MSKTHYRKVFKSDHLGCADLEDFVEEKKGLIFTIKEVRQEIGVSVAGRKGDYNIAYFKESIKPLVLNATNSKIVKGFSGGSPFVEDWKDITIELYVDPTVRMKGEVVGGVRIKPKQPITRTKEAIEKVIKSATDVRALNALRSEIQKYNLSDLANSKAKELQNG